MALRPFFFSQAARRRAVTELMFFASVGDLKRVERIVKLWKLNVSWERGWGGEVASKRKQRGRKKKHKTIPIFHRCPTPAAATTTSARHCECCVWGWERLFPFFSLFLFCVADPIPSPPLSSSLPSHLAASEGCYKVTEWLLAQKAAVNAVDRFKRTPLEEAVRGDFSEVAKLLVDHGAKIHEGGKVRGG